MRPLVALLIGTFFVHGQAWSAEQRFLVSILPPPLASSEFIGEFKIYLNGATILSACHIPYGWQITAGMYDDNSGVLGGEGGLGGSLISKGSKNFDQLRNLFLVQVNAGKAHPQFEGSIQVGRYGADDRRGRKVRATSKLLRLVPAEQCPNA